MDGATDNRLSENQSLTNNQRSWNSWTSGDTTTDSEKDDNDNLEEGEMLVPPQTSFGNRGVLKKLQETSEGKMTIYVYLLSLFAAIGGFLFGYDTGVVSGAMLLVDKYYQLSDLQHELVVSGTIAAAAVGAAAGGSVNECMGRRKTLILAAVVFTIGAGLMAGSPHGYWEVLFTGRIIVGLGIGLASMTVPVYIAECAPPHMRGKLVVANNLFITGGQAVAATVDGAFGGMETTGWRFMLGLAVIPSIVMLIGFLFMPESPRWLLRHSHPEEAKLTLAKIRGTLNVEAEVKCIEQKFREEEEDEKDKPFWIKLKRIFVTPSVRRAVIVGCGLQAIQQLVGINTVMYYSASIIRMAGVEDQRKAIWWSALVACGNFVFTIVGLCLVERLGRRKLLLGSLLGVFLSLGFLSGGFWYAKEQGPPDLYYSHRHTDGNDCIYRSCDQCILNADCGFCYVFNGSRPFGTCQHKSIQSNSKSVSAHDHAGLNCWINMTVTRNDTHWAYDYCPVDNAWIVVVALVCYLAWFAPGMGPMPWTVNSEIYPNWARSTAVSMATAVNWSCNLAVSMTFLTLSNNQVIGRHGAFLIYALIALLGLIFIYALVPETKGKPLEEVEKLFEKSWCPGCCTRHKNYVRVPGDVQTED